MHRAHAFLAAVVFLLATHDAAAAWHDDQAAIMGTGMRVELWSEDEAEARAAIASVWREMHRIDRLMSTYKADSEISAVNREAAARPVAVGAELLGLIAESLELSRLTDGAFDITESDTAKACEFANDLYVKLDEARQARGYRKFSVHLPALSPTDMSGGDLCAI
ncbi:MAG TPA: FAD:protein FMN transferase [Gammaproteobacteria bacterium]|nr:FAD:protein FMN transferase [Gammaproteobacteria bacterium]